MDQWVFSLYSVCVVTFSHVKNKLHSLLHYYTTQSCLYERSGDKQQHKGHEALEILRKQEKVLESQPSPWQTESNPKKTPKTPPGLYKKTSKGFSVCQKQACQVW